MRTEEYKDGHGHINYADINGSGVYDSGDCVHSWGYWVAGGYTTVVNGGNMEEEFVDCTVVAIRTATTAAAITITMAVVTITMAAVTMTMAAAITITAVAITITAVAAITITAVAAITITAVAAIITTAVAAIITTAVAAITIVTQTSHHRRDRQYRRL